MADVFNSIRIGFEWAQDLTLPVGTLGAGDVLRAEFRYKPEDAAPIFTISSIGGGGIAIVGDSVSLVVSASKTKLIVAPDPAIGYRAVFTDLVRVPASGPEADLGFRLRIPAVLPVTRPAP